MLNRGRCELGKIPDTTTAPSIKTLAYIKKFSICSLQLHLPFADQKNLHKKIKPTDLSFCLMSICQICPTNSLDRSSRQDNVTTLLQHSFFRVLQPGQVHTNETAASAAALLTAVTNCVINRNSEVKTRRA